MTTQSDYFLFLGEIGISEPKVFEHREKICFTPMSSKESIDFECRDSLIEGRGIFSRKDIPKDGIISWAINDGKWSEIGRYMNHGVNPNCAVTIINNSIRFISSKAIKAGDELTCQYRDMKRALEIIINNRQIAGIQS